MRQKLAWMVGLAGLGLFLSVAPTYAAIQGKTPIEFTKPTDTDYLLWADEVETLSQGHVVIARGTVQIVNQPYTLLADEVEYHQDTGEIYARGHVRLVQDTGEMVVADELELNKQLGVGNASQFGMLFKDKSRLLAREAHREHTDDGKTLTVLERGTFTSCELCKEDPSRPPIWQLHAKEIRRDETDQRIIYHDAWMDMWGLPIFYTPYFSHPDPSIKQKSGFLPPRFVERSDIGFVSRGYYYDAIAPDQDATFELGNASKQGPLGGVQWRRRYRNGIISLGGSAAEGDIATNKGTIYDTERWQYNGQGRFDLSNTWRTGFEVARTSDDNFLRQYNYKYTDVLRNRAFAERFTERSWLSIEGYQFQDLRIITPGTQPNILPWVRYSATGKAGQTFGGRWSLDGSFLGIARSDDLQDVQRSSGNLGWQRQDINRATGLVSRWDANIRADNYWVQNADPALGGSITDNNYNASRLIPLARYGLSYPLQQLSANKKLTYVLTPEIALQTMPRLRNNDIPDEDSQNPEIEATNLFSTNRYQGLDRVEDGTRVTYGARVAAYHNRMGSNASFMFGQSYQLAGRENYPINSGLTDHQSDWVGQFLAMHKDEVDIDYRFRLNGDNFTSERHEVNWGLGRGILRWSGTYLLNNNIANNTATTSTATTTDASTFPTTHEQLHNQFTTRINKQWASTFYDLRDLGGGSYESGLLNRGIQFTYDDECFSFHISAQRDYTSRRGESSGDTFSFTLSFKNLGDVSSPTLSPDDINNGTSGNLTNFRK